MTALRDYIDKSISADGFISLHDYMDVALYHPTLGYYRRDQVIGADGDFITAPRNITDVRGTNRIMASSSMPVTAHGIKISTG